MYLDRRKTGNLAVGDLLWTDGSGNILGTAKDRKKEESRQHFFMGTERYGRNSASFLAARKGDRITCLDIGQGMASFWKCRKKVFSMDCGSSNKKNIAAYQLLPYLKSRGISYIDGILVSHTDNDHISGIQELMEYMTKGLTSVKAGTLMLLHGKKNRRHISVWKSWQRKLESRCYIWNREILFPVERQNSRYLLL